MLKNKKLSILTLGAIGMLCCGVGVSNSVQIAKANTTNEVKTTVYNITGTATEAVTGEVDLNAFTTVNGASVRMLAPTGIRFMTNVLPSDLAKLPSNAKFGTLLIATEKLGTKELTLDLLEEPVNGAKALNVEAEVWSEIKTDSVVTKYQYSAVLVGNEYTAFPTELYGENLTARSYVTYVDAEEKTHTIYTSNSQSRNAAYVASCGLAWVTTLKPENVTTLNGIVDTVVKTFNVQDDSISLSMADNTTATLDMTIQNAEGEDIVMQPKYTSDATSVVTVNDDGEVTAVGAGNANITVTLGSKVETVAVTVAPKQFEVTFMDGDTVLEEKMVNDGACAVYTGNLEKESSVIGGWTLNGEDFSFETPITEDITLQAKWYVWTKVLAYDETFDKAKMENEFPAGAFFNAGYKTDVKYGDEEGCLFIHTGTHSSAPSDAAGYKLESVDFEEYSLVYFYIKTTKRWEVSYGSDSMMYTMEADTWTKCMIISNGDGAVNVYFNDTLIGQNIVASNLNSTWLYLRRPQDAGEMTGHEVADAYVSAIYGASQPLTVTFMDGETVLETKSVTDGSTCPSYTGNLEKEGFVIVGWTLNGEDFSFDTPITEDITLQAKWSVWSKVLAYDETVIRDNITHEWPATAFWHAEYTTSEKYGNEAGSMLIKTGTLSSYPTSAAGYKLESVDFEEYPLVYFYIKTNKRWEVGYGSSSQMYTMEAETWTKCMIISNGDGTVNVYFNDTLIGQNIVASNLNSAWLWLRRPQDAGEMTANEGATAYISAVYGASKE